MKLFFVFLLSLSFLPIGIGQEIQAPGTTYIRLGGDMEFCYQQSDGSWLYFGGGIGLHSKVYKNFSLGVCANYVYSPPENNRGIVFGVSRIALDAEIQYNFKEFGNGLFVGTSCFIGQEYWNVVETGEKFTVSPVFVMRVYGGKNIKITDHFSLGFRLGGGPEIGEVGYSIQTSVYGLYRF